MPAAWVGAAAAIGGALIGSNATQNAADTQAGATNAATAVQQHQYDQTRSDNLPLLGARNDALDRLEQLLGLKGGVGGIDTSKVLADPGYQFGLTQGQKQLTNSFNARGMRDSGSALKAATSFGNDYATTKYDAALNREVNPLQSIAGLGQSGANTIAAAGTNSANTTSGLLSAQGNAAAAAQIAQGNAYTNAGNQLAGWYQNYNKTGFGSNGGGSNLYYGGSGNQLYGDGYGPQ